MFPDVIKLSCRYAGMFITVMDNNRARTVGVRHVSETNGSRGFASSVLLSHVSRGNVSSPCLICKTGPGHCHYRGRDKKFLGRPESRQSFFPFWDSSGRVNGYTSDFDNGPAGEISRCLGREMVGRETGFVWGFEAAGLINLR